jgi:hypothetical protein
MSGWSSGVLTGRGFRARPHVGLEQGGSVAAVFRDASISSTPNTSGLLQGFDARAMIAETEMVSGVNGHWLQLVRPDTQSSCEREALESNVDILLPPSASLARRTRWLACDKNER